MMSLMLIFKACAYNFLLDDVIGLSLFDVAGSGEEVNLRALEVTGMKHNEMH